MISTYNQLELRHLHYFCVLARRLHFGQAAEELHISQSALSQQIQRLEMLLKRPLFHRTNRKVALTRAGELFQPEALRIQQQLQNSLKNWELALSGTKGSLKIGFVGSAMQEYLPSRVKKLQEHYPDILLELHELSNEAQLQMLKQNQLDLGFMRSNEVSYEMSFKKVHEENLCLVLPRFHSISQDNFKNISQFSEASFILFPNQQSPMYYQQIIGLCASYGFMPKISHRSIHGPTIFKLVEQGLGISIVPKSLTKGMDYDIKLIELKNEPFKTALYTVWNTEISNKAIAYFLALL